MLGLGDVPHADADLVCGDELEQVLDGDAVEGAGRTGDDDHNDGFLSAAMDIRRGGQIPGWRPEACRAAGMRARKDGADRGCWDGNTDGRADPLRRAGRAKDPWSSMSTTDDYRLSSIPGQSDENPPASTLHSKLPSANCTGPATQALIQSLKLMKVVDPTYYPLARAVRRSRISTSPSNPRSHHCREGLLGPGRRQYRRLGNAV
ncbi:hypothetical protein GCM10023317_07010 [Actinopolymorpha pittospori]